MQSRTIGQFCQDIDTYLNTLAVCIFHAYFVRFINKNIDLGN